MAARLLKYQTAVSLRQPVPRHAFAAKWAAPGACRELTLAQRRRLVGLVAATGDLANLDVAVTAGCCCVLPVEEMAAAAAAGQLDSCRWLAEHSCPFEDPARPWAGALVAAAEANQRKVCDWLLDHGVAWSDKAVYGAAKGGHVDLMQALMGRAPDSAPPFDAYALLLAAAESCDLGVVETAWAQAGGLAGVGQANSGAVLAAAAASPTPDWHAKLTWLAGQGCAQDADACTQAAGLPPALDAPTRLAFLAGLGCPIGPRTVARAAEAGSLPALHWLLEHGAHAEADAATLASEGGHVELLQALHTAGFPVDPHVCLNAAVSGGHVSVATWLDVTYGTEALRLDSDALLRAARRGDVGLMEWLRSRGCGWDGVAYVKAARAGCPAALAWLSQQGCAKPTDGRAYLAAAYAGDLLTLNELHSLQLSFGPVDGWLFTQAICNNDGSAAAPLLALRWLKGAGCSVDWEAATLAAQQRPADSPGNPDVVAWVVEQRQEDEGPGWDTAESSEGASEDDEQSGMPGML